MPRFAAETDVHWNQAATAASRVSHAAIHRPDNPLCSLLHGLERWTISAARWPVPFQTVAHEASFDDYPMPSPHAPREVNAMF